MKRINLFFLSLLACLLVGTNAWGADYEPIVTLNPNHTYKIQFARSGYATYYAAICDDKYLGIINADYPENAMNFTFEAVGDGYQYIKTSTGKYLKFSQATPTNTDVQAVTLVDAPDGNNCKWAICKDHCESSGSTIADGVDIIPYGSVGAQTSGGQLLGYDHASSGTPNRTGLNPVGGANKNKRSLGMYRRSEAGSAWRLIENVTPDLVGKAFSLKSKTGGRILYADNGNLRISTDRNTASIWIVEQHSTSCNHCYLRNATTGKYVKFATGANQTWSLAETNAEKATFIISPRVVDNVTYYTINYDIAQGFNSTERSYSMHDPGWASNNTPVTWEPGNANSQWTFEEVSLPTFSTLDNPVWHTWYMRNGYGHMGDDNYFPQTPLSNRPETDPAYQFAFIGDPWNFQIIDAKGQYLTKEYQKDNDYLFKAASSSDLYFSIQKTTNATYTNGKITFLDNTTTNHISNNMQNYSGHKLGFWAHSNANADEGSQITVEPSLENGEEIEIYYIELEGAPDDAVVAYNGRHITNATTFKAIATSTPADDIELEVNVTGYTYETKLVGNTFTITFTPSTTCDYTVHVYGSATGEATYGEKNYANGATITLDNPIVEANIGATNDGSHTFVRAEVDGSHVNIYYAVQTPTSGKAYYLANVIYKTGRLRFYTYTSGGMVWAENNDITSSTSYIANDAGTTVTVSDVAHHQYYMMTADGKFLTWKGSGDGCNSNKGFVNTYNYSEDQGTTTDWTKLAFLPTQNGDYVDDDCDSHWANSVSVYGRRSTGTTYSNIVTKKGDGFDKANENFFYKDETNCYSTIFYLIEATNVVTTAVTFVGKDNQDKTIDAPVAATATYAGVTVPWACPYFRTASIEENSLSANKISGYFDPVITYSPATITWKQNIANYTVNVIGDDSGTGGVTYDGQNHLHNTQFTAPATLTLADLTPIAITGKRALVTLSAVTAGAATITVNYYRGSEIRPTFVGSSDDRTTGECPANLVDENNGNPTGTKWGLGWTSSSTAWITVQADATILKAYDLYNANDTQGQSGRRWKNWKIEGSLDNATWTTIEAAADHDMITTNFAKNSYYVLDNTTPYNYYKITINSNYGGGMIQMSDLKMFMDYRGALGQLLTDVQAISWGTTPGYYAYPEDYETKLSTAQGVYNNAESTDEQLKAQGQIISGMIVNKTVVMPQAGHFYTLLNPNSSKYMLSVNHQGDDHIERLEVATSENITQNKNVFYYNDSKLQGYTEGKFVVKSSDSECQANLDNTGSAIAFVHKNNSTHFYLNINPDDETKRYLLVSSNGYISAQTTKDATCEWQLVDVTDNIYTVSFAEGTPEGANVTYSTTSRTVTKGDVNPWIYSADAIQGTDLTCGTVTGYNSETPVVAETPNRTITVTYTERPTYTAGFYELKNGNNYLFNETGTLDEGEYKGGQLVAKCYMQENQKLYLQGEEVTYTPVSSTQVKVTVKATEKTYTLSQKSQTSAIIYSSESMKEYFGTFCAPYAFEIYEQPSINAYTAVVDDNKLKLTAITDNSDKIIPANTPVILYGKYDTKQQYNFIGFVLNGSTDAKEISTTNKLSGTLFANPTVTDASCYILNRVNDKMGFYLKNGQTIGANKAYLQLDEPISSEAKGLTITFDDDPTSIYELVDGQLVDKNAPIYNVGGQKLNKLQKGINIVNGKKVLF